MINTSYTTGLSYYLNSGSSEDLFAALSRRTSVMTSGKAGGKTGLTLDTVNKMTDPEQKIIYAGQIAEGLQMQADASAKALNPARIKDITSQAQKIMTTLNDAVAALKAKDTKSKEGQINAGVKTCQDSINTTLGTLHTILGNVAKLCDKASPETATTTKASMKDMETSAVSIAKLAGVGWKSLFKGGTSVTGTASSTASLIDLLA